MIIGSHRGLSMQDKLLLLREFLKEISQITNEGELGRLSKIYTDKLYSDSDDVIYQLCNDILAIVS